MRAAAFHEQWRLFNELRQGAAYLDIETDGVGPGHVVTMVGILHKGEMTTLVRGQDLSQEAIGKALDGVKMLVTFNGSSFFPISDYLNMNFPSAFPGYPTTTCGTCAQRLATTAD